MNVIPQIPLRAAPVAERMRLAFTGDGGAFLRLLIRGGLLLIPTLGFYRFWLITDVRRHLWAHTHIGDEALEYTGTARELLIGFLIAIAILVPLEAGYFILGLLAEEQQAFASLPFFLILYLFGLYATYRARRYRATRTVFRGIRFWMTGSAWGYAGRAALWDLLTVLTLGLAYPWRAAALERYKMRHTRFGDLQVRFEATGLALFRRGVLLWLLAIGVPALIGVAAGLRAYEPFAAGERPAAIGAAVGVGPAVALGFWFFLVPFLYPLFQAIRIRWGLEGLRFGAVEAGSDLRKGKVYGIYALMALVLIGFNAVAATAIGIIASMGAGSFSNWGEGFPAITPTLVVVGVLMVLAYLGLLIGFGVITRYFLGRNLWAAAIGSVTLLNLSAADGVTAAGSPASSVGEGLADALDVGAF